MSHTRCALSLARWLSRSLCAGGHGGALTAPACPAHEYIARFASCTVTHHSCRNSTASIHRCHSQLALGDPPLQFLSVGDALNTREALADGQRVARLLVVLAADVVGQEL